MAQPAETRLAGGAGLASILVVGLSVVASGTPVSEDPLRTAAWWVAFGSYLLVFFLDSEVVLPRPPWSERATLAALFGCGLVVWFLAPRLSWTALLFVVTTALGAFVLGRAALGALVVVQTVAIATGGATAGLSTDNVVFTTVAYLSFQLFAALVVTTARKEAETRAQLAVAHADLRAATALLTTSSADAERLRIARDLHDVVGHSLTALALELEVATHRQGSEAAEHVTRARDIAKSLLADVRSTVGELRDAPTGLEPTLRGIVEHLPGLQVELTVQEEATLDEARRIAVVRCTQELVTNTLRHAGASNLALEVVTDENGLRLHAHDDGAGVSRIERGNGLAGMAERVDQLGGELTLASAPGQGFTVTVEVPSS